jgi:hypothetical protein
MTFWMMIDETQQPAREETEVRAGGVVRQTHFHPGPVGAINLRSGCHRPLAPRREPAEEGPLWLSATSAASMPKPQA